MLFSLSRTLSLPFLKAEQYSSLFLPNGFWFSANVQSKEKLGERITALQQLVSPYGKVELQKPKSSHPVNYFLTIFLQIHRKYFFFFWELGKLGVLQTDTASVLHEVMGYIRFLREQVQVLCSPYLERLEPPSLPLPVIHASIPFKDLLSINQ
ncbi:uncharacterized protein LOC125474789 [Pyrus x bretschneideri]|uniref:uncharacterized protein LOC125474789 n=1 Tax=Pyrus x bretschneideri TaxID=225117 RepID=UPI00202FED84|nr:uncharacterized protein LOC125474789 [Pyrus x bretschneideri]